MFHFKNVRRKSKYSLIDSYQSFRNWMFINSDCTQIEILSPTLNGLEMMNKYGLTYVVKGFKNILEFSKWDHLRFKLGLTSMLLASRCLGSKFMSDTIVSFFNNEPLPNSEEIKQAIDDNQLLPITNKREEKRILEREYYLREYNKYSIIVHRELFTLIKQHRLETLTLIQ